jgi:hypothetical protein
MNDGYGHDRVGKQTDRARDLARQLALIADDVAITLDRAADLHEAVSADVTHPLFLHAASHAKAERRLAANERRDAEWLRGVANGERLRRPER